MKSVQPVPPFKLVNKNAEVEVSDVFPNKQFVQFATMLTLQLQCLHLAGQQALQEFQVAVKANKLPLNTDASPTKWAQPYSDCLKIVWKGGLSRWIRPKISAIELPCMRTGD